MTENRILVFRDYLLDNIIEFTKRYPGVVDIDVLYKLTTIYDLLRWEDGDELRCETIQSDLNKYLDNYKEPKE